MELTAKDVNCTELRARLMPILSRELEQAVQDLNEIPGHWVARADAQRRKIRNIRKIMLELGILAEYTKEISEVA